MTPLTSPEPQEYTLWQKQLREYIGSQRDTTSFFWLIDPTAHETLPGFMWELEKDPVAWPLYMNTYMEEAVNTGPFMVPYRESSPVTGWIFKEMRLTPLGCMLTVKPSNEKKAFEHLQNLLECNNSEGKRSIFRYYDPRVAYGISTYRDDEAKKRLLGPLLKLESWEPGRAVPFVIGTGVDHGYRCMEIENCNADLVAHIWNETQIHTLLNAVSSQFSAGLDKLELPEAYAVLSRTDIFLKSYGFSDRYSLTYASCVVAEYGEAILHREDVVQAFEENRGAAQADEIFSSIGL